MLAKKRHESTDSVDLLGRIKEGDEQAAQELFDRFVHRLVGLARKRLPKSVGRRVGADDIVQSAFRSFFVRARLGDYAVEQSGQLWRLLAAITMNKLNYHLRKNTAAKRSVNAETSISTDSLFGVEPEALASDPSADQCVALEDQLRELMNERTLRQRRIVLLLLKGATDKEIASEVKCTLRTVQRTKKSFQEQLEKKLAETTSRRPKKETN